MHYWFALSILIWVIALGRNVGGSAFVLPKNLYPMLYNIDLEIDIKDNYNIKGKTRISLNCQNETSTIVLHSSVLEMNNFKVFIQNSNENIKILSIDINKNNEAVTIKLDKALKRLENYTLEIDFFSEVEHTNNYFGMYAFKAQQCRNENSGITQMQPGFARRVMPCFDEPYYRSIYSIKIVHSNSLVALSSSEVIAIKTTSLNKTETEFQPTVPLATYMLGIALVCNSSYKFQVDNVTITLWYSKNTSLIVKFVKYIFNEMKTIIDHKFPITNLHIVFVPHLGEGMENFGLIAIKRKTQRSFTGLFSVLAHELVHHWGSNIVSPSSWSDLWFAEGYTMHLETMLKRRYAIASNEKSNLMMQVKMEFLRALSDRNFQTPMLFSIKDASSFSLINIFSENKVYTKGSLLVKYLEYLLENRFSKCISKLINFYYMNSINSTVLLNFLGNCETETEFKKNFIINSLNDWLQNGGSPIFNITKISPNQLNIKQTKNCFHKQKCNPNGDLWFTKISLSNVRGEHKQVLYINKTDQNFTVVLPEDYILDVNASVMSLNFYEKHHWIKLVDKLKLLQSTEKFLLHYRFLYDLNTAIAAGNAPIYLIFKVVQDLDFHQSEFVAIQDVLWHLTNKLTTFTVEDKYPTISNNTKNKLKTIFEKFTEVDVCQNIIHDSRACIMAAFWICSVEPIKQSHEQFCEYFQVNKLSRFDKQTPPNYLKQEYINSTLPLNEHNLLAQLQSKEYRDGISNFGDKPDLLTLCILVPDCRYDLINTYSTSNPYILKKLQEIAKPFAKSFSELQNLFKDNHDEFYFQKNVENIYFDDLKWYFKQKNLQ